jgi:signal transduction histidine kinase
MPADDVSAVPTVVDEYDTRPIATRQQILIVDDVPANLVALEAALAPLKRAVITASSGAQALAALLDHEFALVLLDVQMPEMDGFETATLIRARDRTKHLPIIFVTAHDHDPATILRAYQLGAVDFLLKPIEPAILLAKATVFVSLQERTEELATERLERELEAARKDYETTTLRRQMEREQAAIRELAEIDRRKNSFLAIVGHELRAPLAPMRSAIDLIQANPEPALVARAVGALDRQTKLLARLVEDLLDLARINANKIELRPEPIDLRTVIETALETCRPAIDQRRHEIVVELPPQPVAVVVDQVRVVQVITNLIGNAARYTDRGGRLSVVCRCEGATASVTVVDSGIGIPAELLPKIFEMFVQERVRSDGSGGLGLGLALARQLVKMHHGTITAASPGRGKGSTFEVRLPLASTDAVAVSRTRSDAMVPLER